MATQSHHFSADVQLPTTDAQPISVRPSYISQMKELVAGSIAGIAGKVIEHPFDTIKVRLQTQSAIAATPGLIEGTLPFSGPLECFKKTLKAEGVFGLYQGLPGPLAGAMLENALLFLAFSRIQKHIKDAYSPDRDLNLPLLSLCGGLSGFFAALVLTPVELVKCRVQVDNLKAGAFYGSSISNERIRHTSTWGTFTDVVRKDGVFGLYRGFQATVVREMGGCAIWFGSYELACRLQLNGFKNYFSRSGNQPIVTDKAHLSPIQVMACGSVAGALFNAVMFPVDVIKSIEQTSSDAKSSKVDIAMKVITRDGIKGLYRGLGITLFRAVPANACIFGAFEFASRQLDRFL